jgi:hypothetical protein
MSNEVLVGPVAALMLPRPRKALSAYAKKVSAGIASNPKLVAVASPSISALNGLIATFDTCLAAMGGGKAKTAQCNAAQLALIVALKSERDCVQGVSSQQATLADAEVVITSAAMSVKKFTRAKKPPLAVKHGPTSGVALIVAAAIARAVAYYWEWSLDQKTWSSLPDTTGAKTTMAGLTPGTTYYFRVRALVPKLGQTDWSQLVSLLAQ